MPQENKAQVRRESRKNCARCRNQSDYMIYGTPHAHAEFVFRARVGGGFKKFSKLLEKIISEQIIAGRRNVEFKSNPTTVL